MVYRRLVGVVFVSFPLIQGFGISTSLKQFTQTTTRIYFVPAEQDDDTGIPKVGRIERLAVRSYHPDHSRPSSRKYTTRKNAVNTCRVTVNGLQGDYNHYRTVALQQTPDRAVSLWTADVTVWLQGDNDSNDRKGYPVKPGDLGENVHISGLSFDDFEVGQKWQLGSQKLINNNDYGDDDAVVVVEITEPVVPCANLCKLPYINDEAITPKERIARCQDFLQQLDQAPGLRGWYAKVIVEGVLTVHDSVQLLPADTQNQL